jgi:hypothetical protein
MGRVWAPVKQGFGRIARWIGGWILGSVSAYCRRAAGRRVMRRSGLGLVAVLAGFLAGAGVVAAQSLAPLDSGPGVKTCGDYRKLAVAEQVSVLSTIEPLGDELDAADDDAAKIWAGRVADACGDDVDRPLADAAAAALDQE